MGVRSQPDLFSTTSNWPEGFRYGTNFITELEEQALVGMIAALPLKEFEFQGFVGKRRVISFGWRYDFNGGGFQKIEPIPEFLSPLAEKAAQFAGLDTAKIEHALITEYRSGTPIGWHKDRNVFDDVIGISLLSPCLFRFRRKAGAKWERRSLMVEPRSVYLLRGPSRTEWEHSIPDVDTLRYSVTFRTLKVA